MAPASWLKSPRRSRFAIPPALRVRRQALEGVVHRDGGRPRRPAADRVGGTVIFSSWMAYSDPNDYASRMN
jgi:hypothetical protein